MNVLERAIKNIHKTPYEGVIAITGGGTGAIDELLKRGGGSATLLEAVVPYSMNAWEKFLGKMPEKAVSLKAARELAVAAFERAKLLSSKEFLFGLGVSCSLAKAENERVGRQHFLMVAFHSRLKTFAIEVEILSGNRQEQEEFCKHSILSVLANSLGLEYPVSTTCLLNYKVLNQQVSTAFDIDFVDAVLYPHNRKVVYSGSFNPIHQAHLEILKVGEKITGIKSILEISMKNVDKLPLDFIEAKKRKDNIRAKNSDYDVVFTNLPRFIDKVKLFRYSTFIVGADTWRRILDPKYGDLNSSFDIFSTYGTKFLVFGRLNKGVFDDGISGVVCPNHSFFENKENVKYVTKEEYGGYDISSTELRLKGE